MTNGAGGFVRARKGTVPLRLLFCMSYHGRLPKQQIEHFCDAFSSLSRNTRSAHHQSTSYQMTRTLAITAFFALAITGASATALYSTTDSNGSVVYIEETCSKVSVSSTLGALCNEAP